MVWDESLHASVLIWIRQAPNPNLLTRQEADELASDFLVYSRRLNRAQQTGIGKSGLAFVGAIVGLIGYALGGPVGTLAGPLFNFALAAYTGKLDADHRRRQAMIDEMDTMIDNLIDRMRV
jgi:hypothetical protein